MILKVPRGLSPELISVKPAGGKSSAARRQVTGQARSKRRYSSVMVRCGSMREEEDDVWVAENGWRQRFPAAGKPRRVAPADGYDTIIGDGPRIGKLHARGGGSESA